MRAKGLGLWPRFLNFGLWPGDATITMAATGTETRQDLKPETKDLPYYIYK